MRLLAQFIGLLLLIGIVGAYFWPIAATLAAGYLSYRVVLRAINTNDGMNSSAIGSRSAPPQAHRGTCSGC